MRSENLAFGLGEGQSNRGEADEARIFGFLRHPRRIVTQNCGVQYYADNREFKFRTRPGSAALVASCFPQIRQRLSLAPFREGRRRLRRRSRLARQFAQVQGGGRECQFREMTASMHGGSMFVDLESFWSYGLAADPADPAGMQGNHRKQPFIAPQELWLATYRAMCKSISRI